MTRWYAWPCMIHEGIDPLDACPVCATVRADIAAQPHHRERNLRARAGRKGWSVAVREHRAETGCVMRAQTRASVARTRSWKRKRRAA